MRKVEKQQLLEMADTLFVACQEAYGIDEIMCRELCADIQEFAMVMHEFLKGNDMQQVRLLAHLEAVYEQAYCLAEKTEVTKEERILLPLAQQIKEEILQIPIDKIEVVFFCYKASMSDSLESVYLAAKEDTFCDAYFIPIPYFERNAKGEAETMIYEGEGCYSTCFELTDWHSYNVEERRPDAIFIMNPYDGHNYVTSVHPDYYSERLRQYTDNLVYIEYGIPYWLYRDAKAEGTEETFQNQILPSAYLNCHYSIDYSKEMAESHRRFYEIHPEFAKREGITITEACDKFIPLGTPKLDKVLKNVKKDMNLPSEWEAKIQGKKVVLYNTGLGEFLKTCAMQSEKQEAYQLTDSWYFSKIKEIIKVFEQREDVVLWWRPHPLFEATLQSIRPEFLVEYLKIVDAFKADDRFIFDETEGFHRAITWSDALISDESSLLMLYAATGKPFFIPSISKRLETAEIEEGLDFSKPLSYRLANMRTAKGANVEDFNICIWWDNFLEENLVDKIRYEKFTERFLDFVVNSERYPEAEEYYDLQIKMVKDFVVNADGTAGQKIYEFIKRMITERSDKDDE